jgi:hypothetical protein
VSARQAMFRGAAVVVCALGAMVLGAQSAQAEPKPETPPSHSVNSPKPSPTPGAASTTSSASASTSTTTAPASSSGASNSISSASTVAGTTATVHNSSPASSASTALRKSYSPPRRAHTAPPKLGQLFELRVLAGLRDLPSVESPTSSGWLLAAGFALVLLVVAETSFLGLAGSRFGVGGDRSAGKRRPVDEPLAIRRVQLRR